MKLNSRKLNKEDQKICEALFDKATVKYGITDRKFVELSDFEIKRLQLALSMWINDYQKENGKQQDKYFSNVDDSRTFNNYQERLLKNANEIGCSESVLNSLTLYATDGEYLEWPLYRSHVKEQKDREEKEIEVKDSKQEIVEEHRAFAEHESSSDEDDNPESSAPSKDGKKEETYLKRLQELIREFQTSTIGIIIAFLLTILGIFNEQFGISISGVLEEREYLEERKQRVITGNIVNQKNDPISSAQVSWDGGFVVSDSTGYFEVPLGLITKEDTLRLVINLAGYQIDEFLYREGNNDVILIAQ